MHGREIGTGVVTEIAHQILLRLALVVAVPAGVKDQDIALADVGAGLLDDLGRDHRPVGHLRREVDDDAVVDQIVKRERGHVALAPVGCVHGAVEVGADVQRGVDALRHDHLGLQILRIIHLVAGVSDPTGGMHAHGMRQVDDFHGLFLLLGRSLGLNLLALPYN